MGVMENKKIVLLKWFLCKLIAKISIAFWALETVYFIIVYGWHLKAINGNEQICDEIFYYGSAVSVILLFSVLIDIVQYLLIDKK